MNRTGSRTLKPQRQNDQVRSTAEQAVNVLAVLFSTGKPAAEMPEISDRPKSRVPAGSEHADQTCPLCQEQMVVEWDDEADEWLYKDAIVDSAKNVR